MNAHKFVAEKGIDEAKRVLEGAPKWATFFDGYLYSDMPFHSRCVSLKELKQVVESLETIDRWKGLKNCKDIIAEATSTQLPPEKSFAARMIKAIADYELVESFKYGALTNKGTKCEVLDMVDVSPRCEVRNG